MGLVMSRVLCSRRGLHQSVIGLAMSRLAWRRVAHRRLRMSSWVRVEKNDSAGALSRAYPANRGSWLFEALSADRSAGVAVPVGGGSAFEVAESFFLVADSVGLGLEAGAEVCDLGGESGEGVGVVGVAAVFLDHGSELGVAVEGGAADAGVVGDGGEGDCLAVVGEAGAGGFDDLEVGGHAVSAMSVSRRSRRRRCRSASSIQPRVWASARSAWVSTRCAESTATDAASVRKLGQCSQMLA